MDIRDFQEGVSFSRFNTRRLPTEEELRAQAEAELKELVLNAINQVFTCESDTHFDDFALALYQYLKGLNLSVSRTITGNSIDVIIY